MIRAICWLVGHRWSMIWYGPEGQVEIEGPCTRCKRRAPRVSPCNRPVNADFPEHPTDDDGTP